MTKKTLFGKRDVSWVNIDQEYAVTLKIPNDGLHFRPTGSELFLFFGSPFVQNIFRKFRCPVEKSTAKIKDKWASDNGHFDDPQFIIVSDGLRDIAATDCGNAMLLQARVCVPLSLVVRLLLMNLDCQTTFLGLAFRAENDTLNTSAKLISERQSISIGELARSAKKVCISHDCRQSNTQRSFRRRPNGTLREWLRSADRAAGSRLPCLEESNRPSSDGRRDRDVDRRPRRPLGCPPVRRHQCWAAKNIHFQAPKCQWVHGWLAVVMVLATYQDPSVRKPSICPWPRRPRVLMGLLLSIRSHEAIVNLISKRMGGEGLTIDRLSLQQFLPLSIF